jgi:arsenate reductase
LKYSKNGIYFPPALAASLTAARRLFFVKIAFLCTHNACRSILSEAVTRELAGNNIQVASAGSAPSGKVHPLTLRHLEQRGYPVSGLHSKSIEALEAFQPDAVITVCDQAAREPCPVWLGNAVVTHWGLPDPSRLESTEAEVDKAFEAVIKTIEARALELIRVLPLDTQADQLKQTLDKIGEQD